MKASQRRSPKAKAHPGADRRVAAQRRRFWARIHRELRPIRRRSA